MAPGGKPSCLTTLPASATVSPSVSLPICRRTCIRMAASGAPDLGQSAWETGGFEESTPPPTLHEDSLMYGHASW